MELLPGQTKQPQGKAVDTMSTYAILGATGNTGTALIQNLLKSQDAKVHAFCRNKAKLLRLLPETAESKQVRIFEGSFSDLTLLSSCLAGTRAVFLVMSTNDNVPGFRLGQDVAAAVIEALKALSAEQKNGTATTPPPKLILLSSATIDDKLSHGTPWLLRRILLWSASNVYADLRATETILRAQQAWIHTIFIKPGALSVDRQRGHGLSFTDESSPLSYLDLAAAMIEAADDPDGRYDMRNVGVVNINGAAKFPAGTPLCILTGLLRHFFPFLHAHLPSTGPS